MADEVISTNASNSNNPWPERTEATQGERCFDDNFTPPGEGTQNSAELNQSGLQLPDSEHYLAALERKLMRIQSKPDPNSQQQASNRALARDILKSLNAKRDALFQQELPPAHVTDPIEDDQQLQQANSTLQASLSSLITHTALYGALEKKISPQSQALDAEEARKLLDADLLNLVRDSESQTETKTETSASLDSLEAAKPE